ncbi:hypothetical protein [Campylobacter sp. TTU_617]|uniref:hypothetical protein n=1 Tax=Campylobacter sp. TTU_617 TaxID=2768148 RepID=UPI001F48F3D4|nr:hypothetical protein [Campylobacter sp. TTU_617]
MKWGGGIEKNLPNYKNYEELKNKMMYHKGISWNVCFCLIQKDFYFKNLQKLDLSLKLTMAEDLLVFAFLIDPSIKTANFIGYFYNTNENSIMKRRIKKQLQSNLKDCEKILILLQNSNLNQFIIRYFSFHLKKEIFKYYYNLNKISYFKYKFLKNKINFYIFYLKIKRKIKKGVLCNL